MFLSYGRFWDCVTHCVRNADRGSLSEHTVEFLKEDFKNHTIENCVVVVRRVRRACYDLWD